MRALIAVITSSFLLIAAPALAQDGYERLTEAVAAENAGDFAAAETALLAFLDSDAGLAQSAAQKAATLARAAEMARRAGAPDRAAAHLSAAIIAHVEAYGEGDSGLLDLWEAKTAALVEVGDADGAAAAAETAADLAKEIYGAKHQAVRPILNRLADLVDEVGAESLARTLRSKAAAATGATRSFGAASSSGDEFTLVEVFYATSRQAKVIAGGRESETEYTSIPGPMSYGRVLVSVPPNHDMGEIENPRWWRLEFRPDPKKHVVLTDVTRYEHDRFFQRVHDRVADSEMREVLVFIHGYNATFEASAKRAAVLSYDLRVDGAPILYSWPSMGDTLSYVADISKCDDAEWTMLARFLDDVAEKTDADRIQVIAHSLGNCMLVGALDKLATGQVGEGAPPVFDEVVFAAPDVSRRNFTQERADRLKTVTKRMSVYASTTDVALRASRAVRRGEPRLGEAEPPYIIDGVDFVDASDAPSDALGHMHFAEGAVDDLRALLWAHAPANKRCLLKATGETFKFIPNGCDRSAMRQAASMIRTFGIDSTIQALSGAGPESIGGATRDAVLSAAKALGGVE